MHVAISIPLLFMLSVCLYRFLSCWVDRSGAGTFATFITLGTSCCLFTYVFLPVEFYAASRFFGFLALVSLPFLVAARRRNNVELSPYLNGENDLEAEFFEEGGKDL